MTALLLDSAVGVQRPRVLHLPPGISSSWGQEFIELAESAGLVLDEWQRFHVRVATARRADGGWAASEYADIVPRQNGKGGVIECLSLGFLYLLKTPLVLHSAHLFPTALEAFRRLRTLIEGCDDLRRKTEKPVVSNGKEGFELTPATGGGRLRYLARSKGSGRGFSAPVVIFDEAYSLTDDEIAALMPTLSAQPDPWQGYFSSAALGTSAQLHRLRRRALSGDGGRLAYVEHSVDPDDYGGLGSAGWDAARRDPDVWAVANPALGIRITYGAVQTELDSMAPNRFDRERLGVPDPEPSAAGSGISAEVWDALADPESQWVGRPVGVVDVSPDGRASIALCGRRADGLRHVELVDNGPGLAWVNARRAELQARYGVAEWARDPNGPALELGVADPDDPSAPKWRDVTAREYVEACAGFVRAAAEDGSLRWRCAAELEPVVRAALLGAVQSSRGDGAWTWSRKRSTGVDISPLVALTIGWSLAGAAVGAPDLAVW